MNYESVILELMQRIQILEDKVALLEKVASMETVKGLEETGNKKVNMTEKAREYILAQKSKALAEGADSVTLLCNDIQKVLGVVNRAPAICSAMYSCMNDGDEVLYAPPSGMSTTVKIRYYV